MPLALEDVHLGVGRHCSPRHHAASRAGARAPPWRRTAVAGTRRHPRSAKDVAARFDRRNRRRLGFPKESLFPAWASAQRQALTNTAITPPTVELDTSDLGATGWTKQPAVDWILTTAALAETTANTVVLPYRPPNRSSTSCSGTRTGPRPPPSPASSTTTFAQFARRHAAAFLGEPSEDRRTAQELSPSRI
jgi:hypothetical protein